jgi:hypothetical protein
MWLWIQEIMGIISGIAQIAFWVVAATVTVLTYRHARRTVLQPIRTEVFKAQLQAMSGIMGMFLGERELSLRRAFGFQTLFNVNVCDLYDAYAANFFDVQFDRETRPYNSRDCPMHMRDSDSTTPEESKAHILEPQPPLAAAPAADGRVRAARWARYRHDHLYINRQYCEMQQRLTEILENPLLPLTLIDLLTKYRETAGRNQLVLLNLLDDAAKEMPEMYSSLQDLEKFSSDWLWNRYMGNFEHLKPLGGEIVEFIRAYFAPDNLMQT